MLPSMNTMHMYLSLFVAVCLTACQGGGDDLPVGDSDPTASADVAFGDAREGQYHLGPVDFAETGWHNACAPSGGYRRDIMAATGLGGEYLAGVSNAFSDNGGVCDACILIAADTGKTIVARVVTYGVENEDGDIDVSPSVYDYLNEDEYPRAMHWEFCTCPPTGPLYYEWQTEANPWWTSLWVRNPCVPIARVEVRSANHPDFFELRRETDGTLNDDGGFGEGTFTLRIVAIDGQVIEETFDGFTPGALVASAFQFE